MVVRYLLGNSNERFPDLPQKWLWRLLPLAISQIRSFHWCQSINSLCSDCGCCGAGWLEVFIEDIEQFLFDKPGLWVVKWFQVEREGCHVSWSVVVYARDWLYSFSAVSTDAVVASSMSGVESTEHCQLSKLDLSMNPTANQMPRSRYPLPFQERASIEFAWYHAIVGRLVVLDVRIQVSRSWLALIRLVRYHSLLWFFPTISIAYAQCLIDQVICLVSANQPVSPLTICHLL